MTRHQHRTPARPAVYGRLIERVRGQERGAHVCGVRLHWQQGLKIDLKLESDPFCSHFTYSKPEN